MKKCVEMLKLMSLNIVHTACLMQGSNNCYWPKLHKDLKEMESDGTMRGIPIGQIDKDGSKTRKGKKLSK